MSVTVAQADEVAVSVACVGEGVVECYTAW